MTERGPQLSIPAVYMRGGTSRALIFHSHDLPPNRSDWDAIFLSALGSPDPGGRQLNGMGGGISSLSKVAIVNRSQRSDADVDFTFGQVSVVNPSVSYRGNCGNISSAIGPFAVDEGLLKPPQSTALVRIFNTNTGRIIHATFGMEGGRAAVNGDFCIQGVAGTGAPIRLEFLQPGGSVTAKLLPTGHVTDRLDIGARRITVSLIDASNPVVFAQAADFGLAGNESPDLIARDQVLMAALEQLRISASLAMGVAASENDARRLSPNLPLIALLSSPTDEEKAHIRVRMISAGQPHKATPLTGAMCLAVALKLPGSVAADIVQSGTNSPREIVIEHASGLLSVEADVASGRQGFEARSTVVYRTARRLMDGRIWVPSA